MHKIPIEWKEISYRRQKVREIICPFFCRFAWFMKNKVCLDNYWENIASISHNLVSTKDCLRTSKYKIKPNWGQKWWWWCGCGLIFLKQALVDSHIFGRPFSHRILMTSIWIMRSFSRKYLTKKEKKKYIAQCSKSKQS